MLVFRLLLLVLSARPPGSTGLIKSGVPHREHDRKSQPSPAANRASSVGESGRGGSCGPARSQTQANAPQFSLSPYFRIPAGAPPHSGIISAYGRSVTTRTVERRFPPIRRLGPPSMARLWPFPNI